MVATYCTYGAAAFSCGDLRGKLVDGRPRVCTLSSLCPALAPAVEGTARRPETALEQATARQGPTRCNQRPQRWRGGVGTPRRGPAVRLAELKAVQSGAAIFARSSPQAARCLPRSLWRLVGSFSRPHQRHNLLSRRIARLQPRSPFLETSTAGEAKLDRSKIDALRALRASRARLRPIDSCRKIVANSRTVRTTKNAKK